MNLAKNVGLCCGILALTSLSGCASSTRTASTALEPRSQLAEAVQDVAEAVVARLGSIGDIQSVSVQQASPGELQRAGIPSGSWITLTSAASDYLDQARARWISSVIVSEVWKRENDAGTDVVAGGSLNTMRSSGDAGGDGMTITFTPELKAINFRNAAGQPSGLTVSDQNAYQDQLSTAAQAVGLRVTSVKFTESAGSVVQVEEQADDPVGFLRENGQNNPGLTLDPGSVEGIFLTVADADGKVVITSCWSTGAQHGEGGPGPAYADIVNDGDSTSTTTPSPSN